MHVEPLPERDFDDMTLTLAEPRSNFSTASSPSCSAGSEGTKAASGCPDASFVSSANRGVKEVVVTSAVLDMKVAGAKASEGSVVTANARATTATIPVTRFDMVSSLQLVQK